MIVGFMVVRLRILWHSLCWLTVSKAFDMSSEIRMVRAGGFWLKPSTMAFVMLLSAVPVEWLVLKPC